MLQSLCKQVGLLVTFDVYSNEFTFINFLNANKYDLVFIHQTLIYGKHGDHLILNLRCLLSFTPVIIVGLSSFFSLLTASSSNYASLMSLCDFTAFLRVPFTDADLLHYILKYIFEVYEAKVFQTDLQKIPKKRRLRFDGCPYRGFSRSHAASELQIALSRAGHRRRPRADRRFFCGWAVTGSDVRARRGVSHEEELHDSLLLPDSAAPHCCR